mmetsp:Transcript_13884/g.47988  ORF Transcript_13884/g.47988 Transcript_13884/m.47988 type:complete len:85 (-) Transcript_13884:775-1029(-)
MFALNMLLLVFSPQSLSSLDNQPIELSAISDVHQDPQRPPRPLLPLFLFSKAQPAPCAGTMSWLSLQASPRTDVDSSMFAIPTK